MSGLSVRFKNGNDDTESTHKPPRTSQNRRKSLAVTLEPREADHEERELQENLRLASQMFQSRMR